jgi:transposase
MSSSNARKRYTGEFKEDAVNLVIKQGYSCAEAGRRLGISANNITRWVRRCRDQQEHAAQGMPSAQELQDEIRWLRKENKRLQMEREILKKAAAFFAKESSSDTDSSGSK